MEENNESADTAGAPEQAASTPAPRKRARRNRAAQEPVANPESSTPTLSDVLEAAASDARPQERGEEAVPEPSVPVDQEAAAPEPEPSPTVPEAEPIPAPPVPVAQGDAELRRAIETLLFITDQPVGLAKLCSVLKIKDQARVASLVEEIRKRYEEEGRPLQLVEIAEGFQLATRPEFAPYVRKLYSERMVMRLSTAALETLSIISYKQPLTRAEIEEVRGVEVIAALETLLEKRLVKVVGRRETVGRPLLYGTTPEFLRHFGLRSLADLPPLESFDPAQAPAPQADAEATPETVETVETALESVPEGEVPSGPVVAEATADNPIDKAELGPISDGGLTDSPDQELVPEEEQESETPDAPGDPINPRDDRKRKGPDATLWPSEDSWEGEPRPPTG